MTVPCDFPGCTRPAVTAEAMCIHHELVRVSGSWVPGCPKEEA